MVVDDPGDHDAVDGFPRQLPADVGDGVERRTEHELVLPRVEGQGPMQIAVEFAASTRELAHRAYCPIINGRSVSRHGKFTSPFGNS